MSRRIHLDFVGCRLNQAEIEQLARDFASRGDTIAESETGADIVVVNTCAVTQAAGKSSRKLIRRAARANPNAEIVATGCYAELSPDTIGSLPGISHVISNSDKDNLAALITPDEIPIFDHEPITRNPLPPGTLGRTRAFVKVQDGCDNRCTFCITTIARGSGRSRPLAEVVGEVQLLAESGYKEIVLTGVHLGSYGKDLARSDGLSELVRALLKQTDMPRIRMSSLEPWDLSPDFFDLWTDKRVCPHLHLPLQSGCDATLQRMARRTSQKQFGALVDAAHTRIPNLALTTDIIAGFPGETETEFSESMTFVEAMDFARLHVFTYSSRPGTVAARLPGHISPEIKKQRQQTLTAYSNSQWRRFQHQHIGRTMNVLWEGARGATPEGMIWMGHSENYLPIRAMSPAMLGNTITRVVTTEVTSDGLLAHIA